MKTENNENMKRNYETENKPEEIVKENNNFTTAPNAQQVQPMPPPVVNIQEQAVTAKPKKKKDAVKITAIVLAAAFAVTTVLSLAMPEKVKLNNATISGVVTEVDGDSITFAVNGAGASGQPGGAMMGGGLNGMPNGGPPNAQNGTEEQKDSTDSTDANVENTASQSSEMPQMPESDTNSGMRNNEQGSEITVKISGSTKITSGDDEIELSDIEQGDTVSVSFGSGNSVKAVSVSSGSTQQNNMGGMPGNAPDGNRSQGSDNSAASDSE